MLEIRPMPTMPVNLPQSRQRQVACPSADILRMHDHVYEQLERHPDWRRLLTAYYARQLHQPEGWVERLLEVDDWKPEQLSVAHGRLIALGVLDFELGARMEGLKYQVNSLGVQILKVEVPSAETAADDSGSPVESQPQVAAQQHALADAA